MKPIVHNGERFVSLKALHEKYAAQGVSYQVFYERYVAGWRTQDALTGNVNKNELRSFCIGGVTYSSLFDLANAAGITYNAAVKRCHRGWSDDEIFHGRKKPEKPKKPPVLRGIPIAVGGVQYKNIGHAHELIKPTLTLNAVRARLRCGWTCEQAFNLESKVDGRTTGEKQKRGPNSKTQPVAFGVTYPSVSSLARAHSFSVHLVYSRLRKGWTAERAVTEPATKIVEIDGRSYRSAMNAWQEIGNTSFFVYNARRNAGHDLEICLGLKPLKDESYTVNGVFYPSLSAVAAAHGIKESVLSYRLNKMAMLEALAYKPANGRYTLKRFGRDPKLANTLGTFYFIEIAFSDGSLHKIGITQRTLESRFSGYPNFRTVAVIKGRLGELFKIEQSIIRVFQSNLYRADEDFEGRTETFVLTKEEEVTMLEMIHQAATECGALPGSIDSFLIGH